jgi:ABC-type antimicrobial peptide transport system permease subunit
LDFLTFGTVFLGLVVPLTTLAGQIRRGMREGEDHASALARALRDETLSVFLAGLVLILPTLFKAIVLEIVTPVLVTALVAQFSALVAFPALMETIYAMIPRYRSVEDVFGKR